MASKYFFMNISRKCTKWTSIQNKKPIISQKLYDDYQNCLPDILKKSLAGSSFGVTAEIRRHIEKIATYHTLAKEPIQGQATLFAYEQLEKPNNVNDEKLHQIKVLAWAIELVQSQLIFEDDIQDNATTRCGKPCWHLLPDVGSLAINDANMLRSYIYELLRQNFSGSLFSKISNYFNESYFWLNIGQHLDVSLSRSRDYSQYTMECYYQVVHYKSTFFTVEFPVLLALALCGEANEQSERHVKNVCKDLGILLQIQNDYMDCYEDDLISGKSSTDIQKGKCTWPAVAVLHHCDDTQRREFEACYGSWAPEKARIKSLYKQFDLPNLYREEEKTRYESVLQKIEDLPKNAIPSSKFFLSYLDVVRFYTENVTPHSTATVETSWIDRINKNELN